MQQCILNKKICFYPNVTLISCNVYPFPPFSYLFLPKQCTEKSTKLQQEVDLQQISICSDLNYTGENEILHAGPETLALLVSAVSWTGGYEVHTLKYT